MLFSPGTVTASDLPATAPATPDTAPATPDPATASPAPATVDAKAILDAISADREAREARARENAERETYKTRAEAAEARLNEMDRAKKNRLLDPAGYLKKLGYTDKELALTAEGLMFHLVPDKAPPQHVANLIRAQREQDLADQEEAAKVKVAEEAKKTSEMSAAQEREIETRYQASLRSGVAGMAPGSYPASQAWFAEDHDDYAQELFATASKIAEKSIKEGKVVDPTMSALEEVEKKYAARASRLSAYKPAVATTTPAVAPVPRSPAQPADVPKSPMSSSKDKDLIARAARAAFGS